MTVGKVHLTEHFARYRIEPPSHFVKNSLRLQHLGKHGTERIAGRLKKDGWKTQAILVPRERYEHGERVKIVKGRPIITH